MTDYLATAKQYVLNKHGDEVSVLEKEIADTDRFYCFTFQSNEYLRTGNILFMAIGQGYTIINKEDKRFFDFGSRYILEEAMKILDENLQAEQRIRKHEPQYDLRFRYDLRINSISNRKILIDVLRKHRLTYVIPEVLGTAIYRVPKDYKMKLLEEKLSSLPFTFHGVFDCLALFDELLISDCCDFSMLPPETKNRAVHIDKATDEDLKPVW